MTTSQIRNINRNAKFIAYVLGRRPDEFGLIPDERGFVKIKTLFKALHEEDGWRFLKPTHLQEMILALAPPPVEMKGAMIRARDRGDLPRVSPAMNLPKLLYAAIRRRAYPSALEKGLRPGGEGYIVLSADQAMALRLGNRMDNDPVLLTINTASACDVGVHFRQYGQRLYLADEIPSGTFSGPPLPREKNKPGKPIQPLPASPPISPGSYFPDLTQPPEAAPGSPHRAGKREKTWQKDRRQARKHKRRNTGWDR